MNDVNVDNPPYERAAVPQSLPAGPQAQPLFEIVIVDDEEYLRELLGVVMQRQGFGVWLAADGREALDVYRRHHETVDLVLMDVRMPGLDGPQTLTSMQSLNPHVRCFFMSGGFGDYTEEQLLALGADAVLLKPFNLAAVAQLLWEVADDRVVRHSRRPQSSQAE